MPFIDHFISQAKAIKKTIVLPEGFDKRVIEAAAKITQENIAKIILLGDPSQIQTLAKGVDLSKVTIINPRTDTTIDTICMSLVEIRKSKGLTHAQAKELLLKDCNYYGTMLVKTNKADGMVSGAAHATADTLRPALQIIKTAPQVSLVSSFFIMVVPSCTYGHNGTFIFSDCGLIENPSAEELADIAIASAKNCKNLLKTEPIVAMLSYSTYGSAKSELTEKVRQATHIAQQKAPDIKIDGEFQLDAAIVPSVGASKAPKSTIAGKANVLIFPDLNSGNIGYKLVQRLANAEAFGPITQGLAKPINDLSRGCTVEDIVGVVALTAIQAENTSL